uniref:Immunoglobulin-like beta-sandwich domain-containing protein n=1 Tax=Xiphophorus maculatus TaxID=8083 RepID=A0A3B5PZ64_XIPMA
MPSCFPPQIRSSCLCVSSAFPGLLVEPLIFLSSSTDGVSTGRKQGSELLIGSHFSIMCSIRPQYEGGSFQLIFSTSNYTQNQTLPAVNHSALFLFSAAGHAHQGTYRCVYHVYVFSYNFSSISQPLNLTVSGNVMESMRKSSASGELWHLSCLSLNILFITSILSFLIPSWSLSGHFISWQLRWGQFSPANCKFLL